MMDIAVDLHIHSALSPCADDDMTPNNIVNMALIKGLDAIAITDHNSCRNVEAVIKVAASRLAVIPGMEVQSREEVHLLCYFNDLDKLQDFGALIRSRLPDMANVPQIFGRQLVIDERDEIIGEEEVMLISSVDLFIDEILHEVGIRDGVLIPAHIDRSSYSIISQLGFIPDSFKGHVLELSKACKGMAFDYPKERIIRSSDAHRLWEILEREVFLSVDSLSIMDILKTLSIKY